MSMYEKILAQHKQSQETKKSNSTNKVSEEDRFKEYFSTFIPKDVKEATKVIRILPPRSGEETSFEEIKGHSIKVEGRYLKFICPSFANGDDCPFCEEKNRLYSTKDVEDAKLAKQLLQRDMYVVRVIERGLEHEGVKFWRFNKDFRGSGTFDKIVDVIKYLGNDEDITDIENGFDLHVNIKRDQNDNAVINSILADRKPSKLSEDPKILEEILNNTKSWRDVYKVYPYEYLKIYVEGDIPFFDKDKNKYVAKSVIEAEREARKENTPDFVGDVLNKSSAVDYSTTTHIGGGANNTTEEDDLPF